MSFQVSASLCLGLHLEVSLAWSLITIYEAGFWSLTEETAATLIG